MQTTDYIGYKEPNAIGIVPVVAAAAIQAAATLAPYVISWASGIFAHPARDTRGIIASVKPLLVNKSASERMHLVLAAANKMPSKDVEANEWMVWYRDNYPNDYKELSVEDKNFWNNYCLTNAQKYFNTNNAAADYNLALFSPSQVNYNATPIQTGSNFLQNLTSGGIATGSTNWVLYGAIGLGLIILFSKK
jgi:hypothetical protein